jgi:hypothetical protein
MCPQQGIWIQAIGGTLNIEITVTGAGGWVREVSELEIQAQITIEPRIWFSPDTVQHNVLIKLLWRLFDALSAPFPSSKATAIRLSAYGVDQQNHPLQSSLLTIRNGLDPTYAVPPFARHDQPDSDGQVAAMVVHLAVEIGQLVSTGHEVADWFNALVMDIFNLASGDLLRHQTVLSWNVWALAPEPVFTPEWARHAEYWRYSLDVNHRSPQYYQGEPFVPALARIYHQLEALRDKLAGEGLLFHLSLVKDIHAELSAIIATNRSKPVVFL